MDLVQPGIGLIVWLLICLIYLSVIIFSIFKVGGSPDLSPAQKYLWIIVILFVPVLGFIFFVTRPK